MLTACATDSPPCAPRLSHRHKAWPRTPGRSPGSRCGWKSSWARAASERCGWVSLTPTGPPAHQALPSSPPPSLTLTSAWPAFHSSLGLFGPQFLFSPELLGCICDSLTTRCVIFIKATHGVPDGAVGLRRPSSRWGRWKCTVWLVLGSQDCPRRPGPFCKQFSARTGTRAGGRGSVT